MDANRIQVFLEHYQDAEEEARKAKQRVEAATVELANASRNYDMYKAIALRKRADFEEVTRQEVAAGV